jgi:hypothetical protein
MQPPRAANTPVLALLLAGAAVLVFGLWVALRYSLASWRPDGDIFVTVELWRGIQRYGPGFVSTWNYTPDNWLLSIVPLTSLLYQLFGPAPGLTVGFGWLVFAASVGLTATLVSLIVGWRWGLLAACVSAYANMPTLGVVGYLAYPISHNVSMAWSLAALLLATQALKPGPGGWIWSALVGGAVFANVVSDPWAMVAIGLPLIAVSAAIALVRRREPVGRAAAVLCGAALLATVAGHTRAFGLLRFLPPSHFVLADFPTMQANVAWSMRVLATMFNIVPGAATSTPTEFTAPPVVDAVAISALLAAAATLTLKEIRRVPPQAQLVMGAALVSMAGVTAAFLLGRWPLGPNVGRFFPNIYFLAALMAAIAAARGWTHWGRAPKLLIGGYAALFMLAGLASSPQTWLGHAPPNDWREPRELGAFLEQHDLKYGYGPFWGASALVMPTATAGRVTIRPVTFRTGRITRRFSETSSHWYGPSAESAPRRQFLLIRSDGEECPSPNDCIAIARRQFGPEAAQLTYGDMQILVWSAPIQPRIVGPF